MQKFDQLTGVAAPLDILNIDTDMIIPKQFLKTIKRSGLGKNLFDEMRYDRDGSEMADFVLNRAPYRQAEILVAGDNFGCGSSRDKHLIKPFSFSLFFHQARPRYNHSPHASRHRAPISQRRRRP